MNENNPVALPYLPPEWVLIAGGRVFIEKATVAVRTDDETLTVRSADNERTLNSLIERRAPIAALVDLDAEFGARAVASLTGLGVPLAAVSTHMDRLDALGSQVATLVQKPFSNKGLQKVMNGLVGRR